jgi:carboxymethylenebutenolidase
MDKDITRRTFAATGLVTGFTLATGPLNAAAIVTDTRGIDAGEVSVAVADGHIPAYRARPERKHDAPVVLVVQEIFGVHEHIKDLCRRLAKTGYYAIAPSLYARFGDPGKYDMAHAKDLMTDIVSKVPDNEVMSDLDSTVAFAKGEGADAAKLAITGFCWGGRVVWLYTAHSPDVKAGVAWYGPLAGTPNALRPHTATELAGDLHAPVLGLYAGLDKGITAADIDAMRAALAKAGKTASRIDVFPDAQHGFNADYRDSYNEKDAKDGWARMLSWFKANGVA